MNALAVFKSLADPVRYRIIRILEKEPLSVNEICQILDLKQSRISRHLGIMSSAGLLQSHRNGSSIIYWRSRHYNNSEKGLNFLRATGLIEDADCVFEIPAICRHDLEVLGKYLQKRESSNLDYFQNLPDNVRQEQEQYVDSGFYYEQVLNMLPEKSRLAADLGCGNGELSALLKKKLSGLICMDQSKVMLDQARQRIGEKNTQYRLGSLSYLPLRDAEVDLVIASMILHHMPEPDILFAELSRVLKKNGTLILAEIAEHSEEKMRSRFSDFWLGFSSDRLREWFGAWGFQILETKTGKGTGQLSSQIIKAQLSGAKK